MARTENKRITLSKATVGEFKGNPVLNLNPDGKTNMAFGLGKAMLVFENLAAIGAFLKSDGKSCDLSPELKAEIDAFAAKFLPKLGE